MNDNSVRTPGNVGECGQQFSAGDVRKQHIGNDQVNVALLKELNETLAGVRGADVEAFGAKHPDDCRGKFGIGVAHYDPARSVGGIALARRAGIGGFDWQGDDELATSSRFSTLKR